MRVVVTKQQLTEGGSCGMHLDSPEWNAKEEALVFADWDKTARRLLSTEGGVRRLRWLVERGLVPMTVAEFETARAKQAA